LSVSADVTLPAQPSVGAMKLVPLGGNGFNSPHSMYLIGGFGVAGDASGGNAVVSINMDDRFQCLCSVIESKVDTDAVAATTRLSIHAANIFSINVAALQVMDPTGDSRVVWSPPSLFNANLIKGVWANIGTGEDYLLSCVIYNFDKRASELVPLSTLLASLPRATALV